MRQVFSSHRIENVEGVARLLEEHGIQVRITNGRGWKGAIRGNFSYRDTGMSSAAPKPAVWVVNSGDSPQARELLREAGLVKRERDLLDSYLPQSVHDREKQGGKKRRLPRLFKLALLVAIGLGVGFVIRGTRQAPAPAEAGPASAASAASTEPTTTTVPIVAADGVHVIATPPALARALVLQAMDGSGTACLSIDDRDPDAATLGALRDAGVATQPLSSCADPDAVRFAVSGYRTDGSGQGTVRMDVERPTGADRRTLRFDVERNGFEWIVEANPR